MELVGEGVAGPADPLAERIAPLDHEPVDDAVKDDAIVVRLLHLAVAARVGPLLAALGEPDEVLDRLRRLLVEELRREGAFRCGEHRIRSSCHGRVSFRSPAWLTHAAPTND